jgi:PAS domain S-box-containing protein
MNGKRRTRKELMAEVERMKRQVVALQKRIANDEPVPIMDNKVPSGNRNNRMAGLCSQALLKSDNEKDLLSRICYIITHEGGYQIAWIGYKVNDDEKLITPVAWSGEGAEKVIRLKRSWAETSETGNLPAAIALREGKTVVISDILENRHHGKLITDAGLQKLRSGVAVPIKDDNVEVFGMLQVYSGTPDFFSPDDISLIEDIAHNLAYGINAFRLKESLALAGKKLQKSEEDLKKAQKLAGMGTWEVDLKTGKTTWSENTFLLFGLKPNQITPSTQYFDSRVHPGDLPKIYQKVNEIEKTGLSGDYDFRMIMPDGKEKWFYSRLEPVFEGTKLVKLRGTNYEITGRKRREESLRISEEALKQAQEVARMGSWKFDIRKMGYQMSDNMYRLLGFEPGQVEFTFDFLREKVHPKDIRSLILFLMNPDPDISRENHEFRFIKSDGETIWLRTNRNIVSNEGEITEIVGTTIDITYEKRKEHEAVDKTRQLEAILQAIPDLVLVVDRNGICMDFRPDDHRRNGIQTENRSGRKIGDVLGNHEKLHVDKIKEAFSYNGVVTYEYDIFRNQQHDYFEARISPIDRKKALFLVRNITGTKSGIEEIRKLSKVVEQSPVSVLITNTEGNLEYVNPWFTITSGYSAAEVLGKNPRMFKSEFHNQEFYGELWSTLLAGHQWKGIIRNKKKNGEIYWESAIISPLKDEQGNITNYIEIKEDITEKVNAIQKIRDKEVRLQAIVNNSLSGITIVDCNGICLFSNPASENIHGFSPTELKGNSIDMVIYPDDLSKREKIFQKVLSGETQFGYEEIRMEHKVSKKTVWVDISISKYPRVSENDAESVLVVFQDITAKKETEQKLINSLFARDKLFSIIAHDLRGPVSTMIPLVEILLEDQGMDEIQKRELLEGLKKSTMNTLDLLENLLSWTKYQADSLDLKPTVFDINAIIREITELYSSAATYKSICLESVTNDIIPVWADEDSVRLVIRNLVSNAIKFTRREGSVHISVSVCKKMVTVAVTDNGIGIPSEKQKTLFSSSTSTPGYGTENEKGSGLGLILCKEFVEKNGGKIFVESAPERGSCFKFTLHGGQPEAEESGSILPAEEPLISQISDLKVLLVEDEPFNRIFGKKLLSQLDTETDIASNGKEAIDMIRLKNYDIVFMDIEMPFLNGFETVKIIRNELGLKLPVIALTAYYSEDITREALDSGFTDYIVKPANAELIGLTIGKWTRGTPGNQVTDKQTGLIPAKTKRRFSNPEKLKRALGNDREIVSEMIRKFLDITPAYHQEMLKAFSDNDFISLKKVAHKLKSSVILLASDEVASNIREIHQLAGNQADKTKIAPLMEFYFEWYPKLCLELSNMPES